MPSPPSPPPSPPPLQAAVTSQNGEITCSVAETNRIRAALGLKPLRTSTTATADAHAPPTKQQAGGPSALRSRLAAVRRVRQTRFRAVAPRSIAEEALLDDDDDDEEDEPREAAANSRDAELQAWVRRTRMRQAAPAAPPPPKPRRGDRPPRAEQPEDDGAVLPAVPGEAAKEVAPGAAPTVLVLADTPVLPADRPDGEDAPGDTLEDVSKRVLKRPRSPDINGLVYDGTDAAEFAGERVCAPGEVSVALDAPLPVESDYKEARDVDKAFARRRGREGGKRSRKKRRRTRELEDGDVEAGQEKGEQKVVKGRMRELQRAADAKFAAGEADMAVGSSDDDELYASLAKARQQANERKVKSSVDAILQAINRANDAETANGGQEQVLDDAERIVYNEMEQFLQKIPAAGDDSDSDNSEETATQPGSARGPASSKHMTNDDSRGEAAEATKEVLVEAEGGRNRAGSVVNRRSVPVSEVMLSERGGAEKVSSTSEPAAQTLGLPAAGTGSEVGMAAVLQRLRAMGELKHQPEQKGRARDKRFDSEELDPSDKDRDRRGARPEVRLEYLDEFGNKLTRKEAFRVLCHKFHGKGPGQNKREKRLRKMLEAIKVRSMHSDDTPLASAAALKAETRKLGSAHVVLSGSQALFQQGPKQDKGPSQGGEKAHTKQLDTNESEKADTNSAPKANMREEKVTFSLGVGGNAASKRRRR